MKIKFVEGDGSYFAISENVFWQGRMYDELLWAEVKPSGTEYVVIWEDAWNKPMKFSSFDDAEQYIIINHKTHKPYVNGKEYGMDDDVAY